MRGIGNALWAGGLALSVGLVGCVGMPPAQHVGMDRLETLVKPAANQRTSTMTLTVTDNTPGAVAAAAASKAGGYKVNYVAVNDWNTMKATLTKKDGSPFNVAGAPVVTHSKSGAAGFNTANAVRSATVTLTELTAGAGYKLEIELVKTVTNASGGVSDIVIARGAWDGTSTNAGAGFTLIAGTNNITVPLAYVTDASGNRDGGKIQFGPAESGSETAVTTSVSTSSSYSVIRHGGFGTAAAVAPQATANGTYLNTVHGVTTDATGNMYVAEAGAHRIVKFDSAGASTVFAGTGASGNGSDGVGATTTALNTPHGLLYVKSSDTLYVADYGNNRIRRIVGGSIFNVAGGGATVPTAANTTLAAGSAALSAPMAMVMDQGGNLYFSEYTGGRICKVSTDNIVTVVASGLTNPGPLALDMAGKVLWFGSAGGIHKITTVDTAPAAPVLVSTPSVAANIVRGLAYDQNGLLFASVGYESNTGSDTYTNFIYRIPVKQGGAAIGSLEDGRTPEAIAGTANFLAENSVNILPSTLNANALTQGLMLPGWSSLYIDMHQSNDPTNQSATLYGAFYRGTYGGNGNVGKFTLNPL
ncbi:MAG: hypothetical protein ACK46X_08220 [Candidatus Sericytochromatia bacterium]